MTKQFRKKFKVTIFNLVNPIFAENFVENFELNFGDSFRDDFEHSFEPNFGTISSLISGAKVGNLIVNVGDKFCEQF